MTDPHELSGPTTKRGTDIDDARRLLETVGTDTVAGAIGEAGGDLPALTAALVERLMIRHAERSTLWVRQAGSPGSGTLQADDLHDLGIRLHARLTR